MPVQRTAGSGRATTAAVTVTTAGVLPAYLAGVLSVQLRADLGIDPSLLGQRSRCRAAGGWGRPAPPPATRAGAFAVVTAVDSGVAAHRQRRTTRAS